MVKRWKLVLMGLSATVFALCPTSCLALGALAAWALGLFDGQTPVDLIP